MGVQKKTRKFAAKKRLIGQRDARLKPPTKPTSTPPPNPTTREIPHLPSSLFFTHNTALRAPYSILLDTSFISHSVRTKLALLPTLMDCLYATCTPVITDCVMAELEKLGPRFRVALRIARDERWERVPCAHKGTYADDCIVERVQRHRVYVVATNDRALKRRVRKVPGVPVMSVARGRFVVERLPDAPER